MGVYDIASNTWSTMALPFGVYNVDGGTGNITAVGNVPYVVVGTVFVSINPSTGAVTNLAGAPDMPGCSDGNGYTEWAALVPYQGKIYGHQGDSCTGMAVYDMASNSWTTLSCLPDGAGLGGPLIRSAGRTTRMAITAATTGTRTTSPLTPGRRCRSLRRRSTTAVWLMWAHPGWRASTPSRVSRAMLSSGS